MTTTAPLADMRVMTLCFHGIGQPGRPLEPGEDRFWISADQFRDILGVIAEHPRKVDLTFDDSNESDFTHALPALLDAGKAAQFFVIVDRLDTSGSLCSEHVRVLHANGMNIGTHGMTHRPWRGLGADQLEHELAGSVRALATLTHAPVRHAAFPQGQYDRRSLAALKRLGFTRAYSVDEGWSKPNAWLRTRYSVFNGDSPDSIRALLDDPNRTAGRLSARAIKMAVKRWR